MPTKPHLIYWFEDDPTERDRFFELVEKKLPKSVKLVAYPLEETDNDTSGTYRHRIHEDLSEEIDQIRLIVCDQDLSTSVRMRGLSGDPIETLASIEGIPLLAYSKGMADDITDRIFENKEFSESRFIIDLRDGRDNAKLADYLVGFYTGCTQIYDFLVNKCTMTKGLKEIGSPAHVISELLETPEAETRLSLYSSGDQQYLERLTSKITGKKSENQRQLRIISSVIAYWLWDSVLRFPGIFLNATAAASLLGIIPDNMQKAGVKKLFETAKYNGPFSGINDYWWRDKLEEIISEAGYESGYSFLQSKRFKVTKGTCSVDGKSDTGYYCMISKKPVSKKNSKGEIPYFPDGADLARISNSEISRLPWAGISQ